MSIQGVKMQHNSVREVLQVFFEKRRWDTLNHFKAKDANGKTHLFSFATLADELKNPDSDITKLIMHHVSVLDDLVKLAKEAKNEHSQTK
jgi:hypothetical protein